MTRLIITKPNSENLSYIQHWEEVDAVTMTHTVAGVINTIRNLNAAGKMPRTSVLGKVEHYLR